MLKFVHHYVKFSGEYRNNLRKSFVYSFFDGILLNFPAMMFIYLLMLIKNQALTESKLLLLGGLLLLSVVLRMFIIYRFNYLQSLSAYEICAKERIQTGDRLKRFPLGFFSEGNLGRVSSILTQELIFFEEQSFFAFGKVVNAYASLVAGNLFLLFMNAKIGLFSVALSILGLILLKSVTKVGQEESKLRQEQQEVLTASILEYVMGIGLIKSFRMKNHKEKEIQHTAKETKDKAIRFEKRFVKPAMRYTHVFSLATAGIVFLSYWFYQQGSMDFSFALGFSLFAFFLYLPMQALAPEAGIMAVTEACLIRFESLKQNKIIDEGAKEMAVSDYEIVFQDVDFSYEEEKQTLQNIRLSMAPKTMNALVGHSGSGKTTVANLVMRFWDVDRGQITLGGIPLKEMTCDSILKNVAAVFQRVYLFHDSILNNIKFGNPDATMEEVVQAAKAARCHDFISKLPQGYDTVVDEGGASLSGGEKQRISIARAILKDAPIIILDEATSSVDPDNEYFIQQAINALVRGKTLIVIAHRLHTIKHADQIIVMEEGKVAEVGKHETLLAQNGIYKTLWDKRNMARSWKMSKK